jgi:two-component SAPR family response regulator
MLLRDAIDKSDIDQININIEAYRKVASFFEQYLEEEYYAYAEERLNHLNGILAEYMIAREMAIEQVK